MDLNHFAFSVDGPIATILLDRAGEPVNMIGPVVFDEFHAVVERVERDPAIKAVVIGSAKPGDFLAGADIRFFDTITGPEEGADVIRHLHALYGRIEELHRVHGKPVVMAINGACLGGGMELALTGSTRIASDARKTVLGQPEVQLGILPAGGGTQRLPKLVGIAAALDLILTGRRLRPEEALRIGLVDEVVPHETLHEVARERAFGAIGRLGDSPGPSTASLLSPSHLRRIALEGNPVGRRILFGKAKATMLAETKGLYPAPKRALEAVRIGVSRGSAAGFEAEAEFFGELVVSPESRALRHLFFASQAAKRATGVEGTPHPRPVTRLGVVGGGLMGAGIAAVTVLRTDATVRIREVDDARAERALEHVAKQVSKQVSRRRIEADEAERVTGGVTASTEWAVLSDVDLVIEAAYESLDLKRDLLREVERIAPDGTVFASNTSSLPITQIAAGAQHPEAVLGMHYFSPVEKMPLLEVVVTGDTADWATATAVAFGKRQGKTVIVVGDGPGFYTTRILVPYLNEAFFLLADGASVEAVDAAMEAWGFPVGPLRLVDEIGADVGAHVTSVMVDAFGERMAGPAMMSELVDDGRKGRKNRRGFYRYDDRGGRDGVDETVYPALGLGPRRVVPETEIQERISLAMVDEAVRCLEEGVLRSATDGDLGAVLGLGFPPFRGGPFWWIDRVGAGEVVAKLDALAARHGDRFEPADLLREHAAAGKRFR